MSPLEVKQVKKVFKDRKPRKNKFVTDWEVEEKLKRYMVETIQ